MSASRFAGWTPTRGIRDVDGRVVDGVRPAEVAGATLISAPDDWPAEQVVAAMTETLAAHSRDEVPH